MKKPEFIARQGRRPSGLLGHIVAHVMAVETRSENERTLEMLALEDRDDILELGFGHGTTLDRAARIARHGHLAGVDYSQVMLEIATRRNRRHIADGRMDLRLADSAGLPFSDASFDKVFAVHTVYFWPKPARHLAEAYRVLKPGGRVVLTYRSHDDTAALAAFPPAIYRFPTVGEVERDLAGCGFIKPQVHTERVGSRLVTWSVAEKPATDDPAPATTGEKSPRKCA